MTDSSCVSSSLKAFSIRRRIANAPCRDLVSLILKCVNLIRSNKYTPFTNYQSLRISYIVYTIMIYADTFSTCCFGSVGLGRVLMIVTIVLENWLLIWFDARSSIALSRKSWYHFCVLNWSSILRTLSSNIIFIRKTIWLFYTFWEISIIRLIFRDHIYIHRGIDMKRAAEVLMRNCIYRVLAYPYI